MTSTVSHISSVNKASPHLFIVDDNPTLLMAMGRGLRKRGYTVSTYNSGEDAVVAYKEKVPDLVILDCKMPGMSGSEAAQLMLEYAQRPIVMLSGQDDADVVHGMIAQGVSAFLVKPMSSSQVAAVVESALSRFADLKNLMLESENIRTDNDRSREVSTAVGIVMAQLDLSHEQASEILRKLSCDNQQTLRELACDIVNNPSIRNDVIQGLKKD